MISPAFGNVSYHDRDDFVRNLVTILLGGAPIPDAIWPPPVRVAAGPSKSLKDIDPVLTLEEVKAHLRIEPAFTEEDDHLTLLERAAHLHTQNVIRLEFDATVGENIKTAMLLLIAHWYRNREAIGEGKIAAMPLAYEALLAPERDYPPGIY